jgi:hypothetical protein
MALFGCFVFIFSASFGQRHIDTVFLVRTARRSGKDSMESSRVHSRLGNQGSQFAEEIQRIEDDMGRAITIRRFKLVAQDMGNFAMLSKTALTSREGARQKVRYASTMGSQILKSRYALRAAGFFSRRTIPHPGLIHKSQLQLPESTYGGLEGVDARDALRRG